MADRKRKNVYEKIEDMKNEIRITEEKIVQLNVQLNALELEKDELEMRQLFTQMKKNNIDIKDALAALIK